MSLITLAALLLLVVCGIYLAVAYNRLVRLRTVKDEALSGIEVQFKKRYDLLPNLVETVKGYASHEKELLTQLTGLRSHAGRLTEGGHLPVGQLQEAEKQFSGVFSRLLAVSENYPQLKADASFLALQQQLVGIERDLEMARRFFNGAVRDLNIQVESFPSNIAASLFGFGKEPFFYTETTEEKQPPKVRF